tara:strand:- start:773 stop:985 length:213 start_codon:yes stop_codon:yes gene_type:complete
MLKILLIILFLPTTANAYFGPGLAAGGIALVVGFILAGLIFIASIFYFPIKFLLKKFKKKKIENKKDELN